MDFANQHRSSFFGMWQPCCRRASMACALHHDIIFPEQTDAGMLIGSANKHTSKELEA